MSKIYKQKITESFSVTDPLSLFTGNGNVALSNINAKNYTDSTYFGVIFNYNDEKIVNLTI